MKLNKISGIVLFAITLTLVLIFSRCSNSESKKTESSEQETTVKDNYGNTEPGIQQTNSETTNNSQNALTESEKTVTNTVTVKKQETTTTTTVPSKPKTIAEQPKNEPVTPVKVIVNEEPKVTQPVTVPVKEPVAEKPKEVIVPPPANVPKTVTQPVPEKWVVPAADKNKPNPIKSNSESLSMGKEIYGLHCTTCHGKSGKGDGSKAAQLDTPCGNFTLPAFKSQTDGSIFYKIRQGKGDMPGFKKKIPDEDDIWHVINYIRSLK